MNTLQYVVPEFIYESPIVEIIEVSVEAGFAASGGGESGNNQFM